ncbi:hypothetical protein GCM10009811_20570 [Nostocoides veronense]|uniref:NAD(P)-binding domain-containing protein n=2 Tax=Nostocoides veronense TaxID=330836 RepID=A0ABN2LPZ3_9MICO
MVRPNSTSPVLDHSAVRRVPADLATGQGLDVAMKGVTGVYVIAPNVDDSEVDMVRHVVESAVAQRVPRIAYHSVLHPDDASMPHHLRKARAERLIRDRRPGATVLRPSAYQQNLLGAALSGDLVVPYSLDAVFTNVDLGDVAEVAARVLTEDGHAGATYELAGPERQTTRDLSRPSPARCSVMRCTRGESRWGSGRPDPATLCPSESGRSSGRCSRHTTVTASPATQPGCGVCLADRPGAGRTSFGEAGTAAMPIASRPTDARAWWMPPGSDIGIRAGTQSLQIVSVT